jgi:antitoxin VapB
MPLYEKDPEVDRLVDSLARRARLTKTEVVRLALLREWERQQQIPSLVEQDVAFVQALRAKARPQQGRPADKAFIDALYED